MPKQSIDYSKTVVYSITAPDGKVFVGHTTNLTQRKAHLKLLSTNLDSSDEESKFIKASGGFLAVKIAPVKSVDAKSAIEAKIASEEVRKELVKVSNPAPTPRKYKRVPVPVLELVPTPEPEPAKLMKPEVVLTVPVPVVIKKYPKFKETVPPERKTDAEFKDVHKRKSKPAPVPEPPAPEPPAPPAPVSVPEPFPLPPAPEPVKRGRPRKVPIAE